MPDVKSRRPPRKLSAETKWEIFLQVTTGEVTQADAARKWQVCVSTVIGIRRTVKDAALAALARTPGRPAKERDFQLEALLDLELDEDGTLRLFCGRASDDTSTTHVAIDALIAGLTRRVIVTAAVIARSGDYFGPWALGLAVRNLRGAVSLYEHQNGMGRALPFSEDDYRMTTEGSFDALEQDPDGLLNRLFGRLNRALSGGRFRFRVHEKRSPSE